MLKMTITLSPMPQTSLEITVIIRVMSDYGYAERGWADADAMNFDGVGTDLPVQTLSRHGVTSINVKLTPAP